MLDTLIFVCLQTSLSEIKQIFACKNKRPAIKKTDDAILISIG